MGPLKVWLGTSLDPWTGSITTCNIYLCVSGPTHGCILPTENVFCNVMTFEEIERESERERERESQDTSLKEVSEPVGSLVCPVLNGLAVM